MPRPRGYTLMEMVVVMAIIALLAGLTAPALYRAYQSVMQKTQHDGIVNQLGALSLRAHALGVSFELAADQVSRRLPDGRPLLDLPTGWTISLPTPVHFNFVGVCSGGTLDLTAPDGTLYALNLDAPTCRVQPRAGRL